MAITKTRQPDGSWVMDPQKDYSNGRKPQQNKGHNPGVQKVMSQRIALIELMNLIKTRTNIKDVKADIQAVRNAWPSL